MSRNEINPEIGVNTGLDPASGLPNSGSSLNQNLFGQPLSKAPTVIGDYSTPASHSDFIQSDPQAIANPVIHTPTDTAFKPVYGDEFESGIPPIDQTARFVGHAIDQISHVAGQMRDARKK